MVSALLVLALSASAANAQGLWSDRNVLQVPYQHGSEILKTSILLRLPIVAMNTSWATLRQRSGVTGAEGALRGMLAAVYAEDAATAARFLGKGELVKKYGSFADYLKAFRASLQRAGDLTVQARIDFKNTVWFIVKGAAEPDPRVFAFTRETPSSDFILNETATTSSAGMLVLSAIKHSSRLGLAIPAPSDRPGGTAVPLDGFGLPGASLLMTLRKEGPEPKPAAGTARKFYDDCHLALSEGKHNDYFACFGSNVGAELQKAFDSMDATRKASFTASALAPRDVRFTVDGGTLMVFFRGGGTTASSVLSPQNVIVKGPGNFQLTSPLSSSPLDNLLRDAAFQSLLLSGKAGE